MADFDVHQVREAAARAIWDTEHDGVPAWEAAGEPYPSNEYRHEADAAMAVIVPAVTAQIRALHYPSRRDVDRTPMCPDCRGKAGTHPCGCWQEYDLWPVCGECGEQPTPYEDEDYPCPTVRLLDQIEAAVRGEQ